VLNIVHLSAQKVAEADELFDKFLETIKLKDDGTGDERKLVESNSISLEEWLTNPDSPAARIFPEIGTKTKTDEFNRALSAVASLYEYTNEEPDRILDRCEHRILHMASASSIVKETNSQQYNNRIAAWLIEDYGKHNLLRTTCRAAKKGRNSLDCADVGTVLTSTTYMPSQSFCLNAKPALSFSQCSFSEALRASTARVGVPWSLEQSSQLYQVSQHLLLCVFS
jgi:L-lactate utilization protein LutC